ncbi:MAG: sialidase family protein [Planctomycetia bacterium]|nr:sialidase family protein [Planctomycetia bacterium]
MYRFLLAVLWMALPALTDSVCAEEPIDEGQKPAKIVRPLTENYDDAHRKFQCVSTLCVSDNARIWASWYAGGMGEGEDNYILVATSADGGLTWSKPLFAIDPEDKARAFDEILWTDPNGRVWLFWGQHIMHSTPVGQWEIHTDNPEDGENATWSEPRRICDGVMLNKPIVDAAGRWLYPVQEPRGAAVYVSTDQGQTVEFLSVGTAPPEEMRGADEHNLLEKQDGSLWLYNRLGVPGIGETFSLDGGKTWSPFTLSEIQHPISRFFVRRLHSGNLLLVKHGELDEFCARTRLMAFISKDDGKTWSRSLMIEPRFRCSYPDGDQAPDGTIYITYDRNRGLEREIFCAKFTEDDVFAGKLISPQSQLNILVNKPTDQFDSWWEGAVRYTKPDGMPGEYWDTEKVLQVIKEIDRGEHKPIKNF